MAIIQHQERVESAFVWKSSQMFGLLKDHFKKFLLYRKTVSELQSLSNRDLDDIGISRSIIRGVSYMAVYENVDLRKVGR